MRSRPAKRTFGHGVQVLGAIARCLLDGSGAGRSSLPPQSGVVNEKLWIIEHSNTLIAALNRTVPTVLLDATSNVDKLKSLLAKEPGVVEVPVADGAEIERVCVASSNANRTGWIPGGQFKADKFVGPFRRALKESSARIRAPRARDRHVQNARAPPRDRVERRPEHAGLGCDEIAKLFDVWRARGGEVRLLHYGGEAGATISQTWTP